MYRSIFYIVILKLFITLTIFCQIPRLITHQGYVTNNDGMAINDTLPMTFKYYDALTSGTLVKEISIPEPPGVIIINGVYNVILDITGVHFNKTYYLEITINGEPQSPRLQSTSTPYSQNSLSLQGPGCFSRDTNTVAGGSNNVASGEYSVVSGGKNDSASGIISTVAGGDNNVARGGGSTVAGGEYNEASGDLSTVSGGGANHSLGNLATISGGMENNAIGDATFIGGGENNIANGPSSTIGGGSNNEIANRPGDPSEFSTIGGGEANSIGSNLYHATIGGGNSNSIYDAAAAATIAGGSGNFVYAEAASIGGGADNYAFGKLAVIGGGRGNKARGIASVVSGGGSIIYDGPDTNSAIGDYSVVPGGKANIATGNYSFAAGYGAKAEHEGSFVWADATGADFVSTASNQFSIRAENGVRLSTNAGAAKTISIGERYHDNGILAWGKVTGPTGVLMAEFGVTSVVRNSVGNYTVTIDDEAINVQSLIPIVTLEVDAPPTSAASAHLVYVDISSARDSFNVYITNGNFVATDNDFVFIVTAR